MTSRRRRILPDAAIVEAARAAPSSLAELVKLPGFTGRGARRHGPDWLRAVRRAKSLPDSALPESSAPPGDGPPPAHRWAERDPVAAKRLAAATGGGGRPRGLPVTCQRRTCSPLTRCAGCPGSRPSRSAPETVAAELERYGARPWQIEITALPIAMALIRLIEKGEA